MSLREALRRGQETAALGNQPHADPDLEAARQRSNRREWQAVCVGVVGMLLPLVLAKLGL